MKTLILKSTLWLAFALIFISCNNTNKVGNRELICGSSSKTWHEKKETNSGGADQKVSADDKKAVMQFYNDGNFAALSTGENANGKWTYDEAAKNLSLVFSGANVSKNFNVLELSDKKMQLKAGDGSEMTMEAE
jgi:hypothetical protein